MNWLYEYLSTPSSEQVDGLQSEVTADEDHAQQNQSEDEQDPQDAFQDAA